MTDITVVLWEDHHTDVEPILFSNPAAAVTWAKTEARTIYEQEPEEECEGNRLTPSMTLDRWIYTATYRECDHIRVQLVRLDDPAKR